MTQYEGQTGGRGAFVANSISIVGCVTIGVLGLVAGWPLYQADPLVGLVPLLSSGFLVLFALMSLRGGAATSPDNPDREAAGPGRAFAAPIVMAALVVYLLTLDLVGFMVATGMLVVVALLASGVRRWSTVLLTLVALLGVGLLFQDLLGIDLPRGWL